MKATSNQEEMTRTQLIALTKPQEKTTRDRKKGDYMPVNSPTESIKNAVKTTYNEIGRGARHRLGGQR